MCNHPVEALTPLFYYYDDDWGVKGNLVWAKSTPEANRVIDRKLMVCTKCNTVLAVPDENKIEPIEEEI